MLRRTLFALVMAAGAFAALPNEASAQYPTAVPSSLNEHAYGRRWGHVYGPRDYNRFYHYPYVYYPQNFWGNEYFRSADHLYYRYVPEMRVPVYNRQWFNEFPNNRKYYRGHHFVLDQF